MKSELKYGSHILSFEVPGNAQFLQIREPEFTINKENFYTNFLLRLSTSEKDYSNAAIVISDKTRLCGYNHYLPWLVNILEQSGMKKGNITFYIAYGTHPRQTEEESVNAYGKIYYTYNFIHHDCSDMSVMTTLGTTQRGTPVILRKDLLQSSLIITFGAISHHYFAGFGGGRKLLFPGLGYRESIYHNHSLFLNMDERRIEPGCQSGVLVGNPVAEDLHEIDTMLPPRLSIHGILDSHGKVCQLHVGSSFSDFLGACNQHNSYYKSQSDDLFDCVVASSGGFPKDINFIQAHKSVHNAASFVKDGGTLIILAECRDGVGTNTFLPLFREGGWEKVFEKLSVKYEGNGGTALAMMAKTQRINICMVTSFDEETCALMGIQKIDVPHAINLISKQKGSVAVIQNASMLVR
ncbi:MAG: nickel-dependent lactate racemase [Bacteroidales bacterium]|nr:nickel-dependent lactate racemase [Bacteroidales bacterium]